MLTAHALCELSKSNGLGLSMILHGKDRKVFENVKQSCKSSYFTVPLVREEFYLTSAFTAQVAVCFCAHYRI